MSIETTLAVTREGSGSTKLVLVHGYGCDKTMWDRMIPFLEGDYEIIRYDLMGCGRSDVSCYDREKYGTLHGHAEDLLAVIREVGGPVTVVGHSVSAMTAVLAANAAPELIERVVMICPSPSFLNDGDYQGGFDHADIDDLLDTLDRNFVGWSQQMAPAIMGTPDMPENGVLLTNSFCQADPEIARHFARVTFLADHRVDVTRMAQPALILQCRDDVIVPEEVTEWLRAQVRNGQIVEMDATGHCPHISYPAQTAREIDRFLAA